jgi:hypothetical protein
MKIRPLLNSTSYCIYKLSRREFAKPEIGQMNTEVYSGEDLPV